MARTLLIVPPFASMHRPALGVHVLQSMAKKNCQEVDILYANLIFASLLGEKEYEAVCEYPFMNFLGEAIMGWFISPDKVSAPDVSSFSSIDQKDLENLIFKWRELVLNEVKKKPYEIIGLSSTFDQTNASFILLRALACDLPEATLIMGGANCEDEMAHGIVSLIDEVDHVFSGESELTFIQFLAHPEKYVGQKIIQGIPNNAVNELPINDYSEFFEQYGKWLPNSPYKNRIEMVYESSRGCWWGQKHHCTFCGLNGQGMGFREKSAEKVFSELLMMRKLYPTKRVLMTDNIMPYSYFVSLLPKLAGLPDKMDIFYEQKANIDLRRALLLKEAGIVSIQPGIESLHTESLKLMQKGTSTRNNLALLRYARALNINVAWNYLYGFPGEKMEWFDEILGILPSLEHLQPPIGLFQINIDRFSPFFTNPQKTGFMNLRPNDNYKSIFPEHVDLKKIAYHFCADPVTPTFADSATMPLFMGKVQEWRSVWKLRHKSMELVPNLVIQELRTQMHLEGVYLLIDSRSMHGSPVKKFITKEQARASLVESVNKSEHSKWALDNKTAILVDGVYLPLAVASAELLAEFENESDERPDFKVETA